MFSAKDLFFAKGPAGGYTIAKSLRFRSSASAYLNRTPASAGSLTTWTWSGWVKRGALGSAQNLFSADRAAASEGAGIYFTSSDTLQMYAWNGSAYVYNYITTQVFRDPSSWYHLVFVLDTSNATSTDRVRIYVNGVRITAFGTSSTPTSGASGYVNGTQAHALGRSNYNTSQYFDGYLSEVNFIDGQALDPTYFGQTDTATGVWMPKAYTGTYGTNGFYLQFTDVGATLGSNTGYGKDFAGTNYWTTNNLSSTAGVTYDSMVDTPTNYDNGGNGAGNYCVLNPLIPSTNTFSQGNLVVTAGAAANAKFVSTIGVTSGKWYMEFAVSSWPNAAIGITSTTVPQSYLASADGNTSVGFWPNTTNTALYVNGVSQTFSGSATTWASTDIAGLALDADSGTIALYKNGTLVGSAYSYTSLWTGLTYFAGGNYISGQIYYANFGQRAFNSTPPSGFKALNTQNLPTPTIGATSSTNAASYMNAVTYNGTSASNTVVASATNSGNNPLAITFQPDFVWIKSRSAATDHKLTDSVRGVTKALISNTTGAETTDTNGLTAFTSTGFTVGSDSVYNNGTGPATYVAWEWLAGTAPTTDNVAGAGNVPTAGSVKINGSNSTSALSGSIAATRLSANVTAGFSVVTWTGTGSNATIGHGLGVAPKLIICKGRNVASDWAVYHATVGNGSYLYLDTTAAAAAGSMWNSTSPTSTVFSAGSPLNGAYNWVAYCFAEVAGYSKFGSYTGNGSTDGPFVYCGFRPRYIMIKNTADNTTSWSIWDTARSTYNVPTERLEANASSAESSLSQFDILSNGFKLRSTNANNASGQTIIFAAFAETPFSYSRAR